MDTYERDEQSHPEGVKLQQEVSAADWIAPRLLPISRAVGTRVCAIVPQGYETNVRIFHHVEEQVGDQRGQRQWAEIAERSGRQMHPAVQFNRLEAKNGPLSGSLDQVEAAVLVDVLRQHTTMPEDCWLAIWHGFGFLGCGSMALLRRWEPGLRSWLKHRFTKPTHVEPPSGLSDAPTILLPNRAYYLYRGPIDAVSTFEFGQIHYQSPNLWWPTDRSWFVASEIDFDSTVVGCDRVCADALLTSGLEALEIAPDARLDIYGDTINPPVTPP